MESYYPLGGKYTHTLYYKKIPTVWGVEEKIALYFKSNSINKYASAEIEEADYIIK